MTKAHLDLKTQLESETFSDISDLTRTPLCNDYQIIFLEPIKPKNSSMHVQKKESNRN